MLLGDATETMDRSGVHLRVARIAADKADMYGGVPDTCFAQLFDIADKADIYGGVPDHLMWEAYDSFVASLRTVRGPRKQRPRRAARDRRPVRFCPDAEAARPQLKRKRRPLCADVPALRPRTATAAALEAARAGTPAPRGHAERELGRVARTPGAQWWQRGRWRCANSPEPTAWLTPETVATTRRRSDSALAVSLAPKWQSTMQHFERF